MILKYKNTLALALGLFIQTQTLLAQPNIDVTQEETRDDFNFSKYENSYFAYGTPTSKVQFSFKYKILRNFDLYAGYTQILFWEMRKESMPFRDVNFNPEFFYRFEWENKAIESIDLVPWWHKSNGKSGIESRSLDSSGIRVNGKLKLDNTMLRWKVRLFYKYRVDREQAGFDTNYGPYDVTLSYLQFFRWTIDRAELSFRFYGGGKWGQNLGSGGREATLSFRLFGIDMTPSFYFSYFEGYGESLLRYNKYERNFRVGIML